MTSATPVDWRRRRERGSLFLLRVMRWLSLNLGRPASRLVLYPIALYFLAAAATARRASRAYLRRALGREPGITDLYQHFLTFSTTIHDRMFMLNARGHALQIAVYGGEEFLAAQARHGGLFLFGAHLGSFEAIRAAARFNTGLRVCLAMYEENARQLNGVLNAINPAAAPEIIPLGQLDSMLAVHRRLGEGAVVGILADRAVGTDRFERITLLGEPAWLPTGPFRMAAMLRQPVFFMCGLHRGGNRYDIHLEPLADFTAVMADERPQAIREAMARYAAMLERHCRSAPYNWFNFYDFWETPPDAKT